MQRKLHSDVLANVSRGHLPPYAPVHSSVSLLLVITAMGKTSPCLSPPKKKKKKNSTINAIDALNVCQ